MSESVAWFVEVNSMTCIVFASTLAKAKWIAVRGYREAGYGRRGMWPPTGGARRPQYDRSPLRDKTPRPWTEDHVLNTLHLDEV